MGALKRVIALAAGTLLLFEGWQGASGSGTASAILSLAAGAVLLAAALLRRTPLRPRRRGAFDTLHTLAWVLAATLLVRAHVAEPLVVSSNSMAPTLKTGDLILVLKTAYANPFRFPDKDTDEGTRGPRRGDVVVFRFADAPGELVVKRVAGLPGESLRLDDDRLAIDGEPVRYRPATLQDGGIGEGQAVLREYLGDGPHLVLEGQGALHAPDARWTVPRDARFLLGDNRDHSDDSRFRGSVPTRDILGRVWGVLWSRDPETGAVRWSRTGTRID